MPPYLNSLFKGTKIILLIIPIFAVHYNCFAEEGFNFSEIEVTEYNTGKPLLDDDEPPIKPPSNDKSFNHKTYRTAVMDIEALVGIRKEVAALVTETLISDFRAEKRMYVVGMNEIKTMIDIETQRQMMGCAESSCIAEIGGALGVDYLVRGSIGRMGDQVIFNVALLNVNSASIEEQFSRKYSLDEAENNIARDIPKIKVEFFPDMVFEDLGEEIDSPSKSRGILAIPGIMSGLGAVGMGASLYFGLSAKKHNSEIEKLPPREIKKTNALVDKVNGERLASTITLIGGGALLVSGVIWLAVEAPAKRSSTSFYSFNIVPQFGALAFECKF